jgi:signal transduction protein with GAF and PtsI domain
VEENPMIGFRGASRYYDPRYRAGFALECQAMKKVRDEMGLTNVKLMIPFCRTVEEGHRVLQEMEQHALKRGVNGLEVYVMCEIPSNVILAGEFAEIFDGFSIGSNDLTQLVLGVDRDSEIVAHVFDERNAAVKSMIASVIRAVKAKGKKIGICGQAPSDYPEFAAFLVELGIDSISLNPDAVLPTTRLVLEAETSRNRSGTMTPTTGHGVPRSDAEVFAEARTALDQRPSIPATVRVHVNDGVAWLTGTVRLAAERAEAEETVRAVRGVARVVNEITVAQRVSPEGFEPPNTF